MKQNPDSYRFTVETAGSRLDKFVSENCPGLSRSQAQKLIDDGYVIVNGLMEKANHKIEIGEKIEITIPPPAPTGLLPEAIPVKIIYEDDEVFILPPKDMKGHDKRIMIVSKEHGDIPDD